MVRCRNSKYPLAGLDPWASTHRMQAEAAPLEDVHARAKPTAVRRSKSGCNVVRGRNRKYPVAGLGPAIHASMQLEAAPFEDVDARVKPGQGDFLRVCRY